MAQFDAVAIGKAQDGRLRQEAVCPSLMRGEQPEEPRAGNLGNR